MVNLCAKGLMIKARATKSVVITVFLRPFSVLAITLFIYYTYDLAWT